MTTIEATYTLTRQERKFFEKNGYVGPFSICSPEEMDSIRKRIDTEVLPCPSIYHSKPGQSRHLDKRVIFDLCSQPAIVDRVADLMEGNVVLWRSNFFVKPPGGNAVPWHQDGTYWPIEPKINVTAWLAIDPATAENSCVRVIPGTHKQFFPDSHFENQDERDRFELTHRTHLEYVEVDKAVNMVLKPGEFFLFSETILHASNLNRSSMRRLGLPIRYTRPDVKVDHDRVCRHHHCILLCGHDRHGLNRYGKPPVE